MLEHRTEVERRLAAILAADIAGYSALMGADEEATVRELKAHQSVILPLIEEHSGRVIDTAGDGILAEFASVLNAVKCALTLQRKMADRNAATDHTRQMQFRIGINQGDVVFDEARVYGDAVNIAARLEAIAEPGGICVSSKVYEEVRGEIDVSYQHLGPQNLKNIAQPVEVYRIDLDLRPKTPMQPQRTPALVDKPSIAVLPFANLDGDPSQDYFSDGITADIITELSRFSDMLVIARNSSFQYKGKSPDTRQVGRELDVLYVLEGSVRRAGSQVRISAQLIDAESGSHRWAERYDRQLEDIFAIQDDISRGIASIIAAHVNKAQVERTFLKPAAFWQAHDYYLRAAASFASHQSSSDVEELYEARRLLEHSLSIDPRYARSYALMSATHVTTYSQRLNEDYYDQATMDRAYELARKAIQLDPNLPQARAQWGTVLSWTGQHEAAVAEIDKAIALNPNVTDWRFVSILVLAGEPERAIHVAAEIMRRDPFYPPWVAANYGFALYILERYAQALQVLRDCVSRAPNFRPGRVFLAATYAQVGRLEEARAEAAQVLRIDPNYKIAGRQSRVRIRKRPEDSERLADGLRKAGLPER